MLDFLNGSSTTDYACDGISFLNLRFENDVNKYGTQTVIMASSYKEAFENDVNKYGTQTDSAPLCQGQEFENDVNKYGTQTFPFVNK